MSVYSIEDSSANISSAIYDWLNAEVQSSHVERNKILDDYSSAIEGLKGGWEHPQNFTAIKLKSHLDRLPLWFEAFSYDPDDDFQAARLVFTGLMQVSGSFRNQCYIEANVKLRPEDEEEFKSLQLEDYLSRRRKVVGINIQNTIRHRLKELLPRDGDFGEADVTIEGFGSRIEEVSDEAITAVYAISNRVKTGYDLGIEGSWSAKKMQEAQALWLSFTTDCISLVAKIRKGELKSVPFLEPRSISDQSGNTYYPLDSPVNWGEVLAA